jgi:DNA-binding SARP family transcriptional activator
MEFEQETSRFALTEAPEPDWLVSGLSTERFTAYLVQLEQRIAALRASIQHQTASQDTLRLRHSLSLYATFFGRFAIYRNGEQVKLRQSKLVLELARFLLAHAGRPISRDELSELLWAGVDTSTTMHRLEAVMSNLRQLLYGSGAGRNLLSFEDDCYIAHTEGITTDYQLFTELIAVANRERLQGDSHSAASLFESALGLYKGDFLADHPYVEWAIPRRVRLAEQRLDALTFLSEHALAAGAFDTAIAYCRQILLTDNLRERAHRNLMQAHYHIGERAHAIQQYHRCADALRTELGTTPSLPTRRLYQAICSDSPLPPDLVSDQ